MAAFHKPQSFSKYLAKNIFLAVSLFTVSILTLDNYGLYQFVKKSDQESRLLIMQLLYSSIKDPIIQGSFVEIRTRLERLRHNSNLECVTVEAHQRLISNCDSAYSLEEEYIVLEDVFYFDSQEKDVLARIKLYFSDSKIEREIRYRLAYSVILFIFFLILMFKLARSFSININSELLRLISIVSSPKPALESFRFTELTTLYGKFKVVLEELQKAEKGKAIARATQMLAHDLKGPLGVFQKVAYGNGEDFKQEQANLRSSLLRLHSMTNSIKQADLESMIRPFKCDLILDEVLEQIRIEANQSNIKLNILAEEIPSLHLDLPKVERAIMNLAFNAIEAAKSQVDMKWYLKDGNLYINVSDDGPGVAIGLETKIFESGTSFGKKHGTGLGLAFVDHVAKGHGGKVEYRREGSLSVFELVLEDVRIRKEEERDGDDKRQSCSEVHEKSERVSHILLLLVNKDSQVSVARDLSTRFNVSIVTSIDQVEMCQILYTDDPVLLLNDFPKTIRVIMNKAEKAESILSGILGAQE